MPKTTDPALLKLLGEKVRTARKRAKFDHQQLADRSGLTRTTVVNVENGKHGVGLTSLYDLSAALGVEPADLLPSLLEAGRVPGDVSQAIESKFSEETPEMRSRMKEVIEHARKKHHG